MTDAVLAALPLAARRDLVALPLALPFALELQPAPPRELE